MDLPQRRHVTTTCGSLRCWMRTRQLTPGWMNCLQCLQIWCLCSVGSVTFAVMAMRLAIVAYRCASFGFLLMFSFARLNNVLIRSRAVCLVSFISRGVLHA